MAAHLARIVTVELEGCFRRVVMTDGLTWAKGEGRGVFETPSELAFRSMRRAIRGDLIWDRSMPPGVYVNGFLSLVIMAFWTHAGASAGICSG